MAFEPRPCRSTDHTSPDGVVQKILAGECSYFDDSPDVDSAYDDVTVRLTEEMQVDATGPLRTRSVSLPRLDTWARVDDGLAIGSHPVSSNTAPWLGVGRGNQSQLTVQSPVAVRRRPDPGSRLASRQLAKVLPSCGYPALTPGFP